MDRLNRLDATLQATCPIVAVPRYEPLAPLAQDGHRFLVGADGVYLDLRRPWLRFTALTAASAVPMPYGPVEPVAAFGFGSELPLLLGRFIERARDACPLEHAAWLMFDTVTRRLDYHEPPIDFGTVASIRYRRPAASASSLPAVDIHSHGRLPAFFSATDDRDDNDDAKLAVVFGNTNRTAVSVVARLVVAGLRIDYSEWISEMLNDGGYPCFVPGVEPPVE